MKGAKAALGRGGKAAQTARPAQGRPGRAAAPRPTHAPFAPAVAGLSTDWRPAVDSAVRAMGYDVVDVERSGGGLLRVTIDRLPGRVYAQPGESVTVQDCEAVTRQLRYVLEVQGPDYARLEVSSPGLDRPLRGEADFLRFAGAAVNLTLKLPLQGRRHFKGRLGRAEGGWQLVFEDGKAEQVLSFALDELHEARLVPVLDFKGRQGDRREPTTPGADSVAGDRNQ